MSQTVHISGSDVDVALGGLLVHIEEFSLSIDDGVKATNTRGIPNGYVNGTVSASGDIKLDTSNFDLLMGAARSAGSFQSLEPIDINGVGKTINQELRIAAYGCKLKLSEALNASAGGGEKLTHTIPFEVTDKRFVEINGVPYLSADRTATL